MNDKPLISAGICMGIGLGGFVDGILFHQILQTHSMLSARLPNTTLRNLEVNMFWDGLFHAMTWTARWSVSSCSGEQLAEMRCPGPE